MGSSESARRLVEQGRLGSAGPGARADLGHGVVTRSAVSAGNGHQARTVPGTWDTLGVSEAPIVTPVNAVIGAVVEGVDLADMSDEQFAAHRPGPARPPGPLLPRPGPVRRPAPGLRRPFRRAQRLSGVQGAGGRHPAAVHRGHRGQPARRRRLAHRRHLDRRAPASGRAQRPPHPRRRRRHALGEHDRGLRGPLPHHAGPLRRADGPPPPGRGLRRRGGSLPRRRADGRARRRLPARRAPPGPHPPPHRAPGAVRLRAVHGPDRRHDPARERRPPGASCSTTPRTPTSRSAGGGAPTTWPCGTSAAPTTAPSATTSPATASCAGSPSTATAPSTQLLRNPGAARPATRGRSR